MTGFEGFIEGEVVSAIEPGRKVGVVCIRVGDRVAGRISVRDVVEIGIRTGTAWTEALAEKVLEADEAERARVVARRLVNARPRSKSELMERLGKKEFGAGAARRVVEELERAGIVDDARLADAVAASVRRKGAGRRLMEQKLRERGLDSACAKRAIDAALEGVDAYAEALAIGRTRLGRMSAGLDGAARARRLYGFLSRRGFAGDVCGRVVRALVDDRHGGD